MTFPSAASQNIDELLRVRAKPLCVIVDRNDTVIDVAGDAEHYGFDHVIAGSNAIDVIPFLFGLSEMQPTELAFVETPSGVSAEMHWIRIDEQYSRLLLFDVTLARDQVRDVQGVANEARILKYRLEQTFEELEQSRKELSELAYRDPLTGLANHRLFHETFEKEIQRAIRTEIPLSLLVMDVDFFKRYNDHYGHADGDDCLRAVAHCLKAQARRVTDLCGRVGGEEFAMLLPDAPPGAAVQVGERLRRAIRELGITHADSPLGVVTISVGAASLAVAPGSTGRVLYKAADRALYEAKRLGRDRVCEAFLGDASTPAPS